MLFRVWILSSLVVFVLLYNAEAAISGWTSPAITGGNGTGTLTVSDSQAISEAITTFAATTDAAPITYSLESTVSVPFALSTAGVLTVTVKLDSSTATSYTFKILAKDAMNFTGTATITVKVTANQPPVFGQTSYTTCIVNGSPAETTVITVSAKDPDATETLTYSIDSNGNTDFKIDSSGVIKVNTGKTLDMATTPAYKLDVKAVDSNPDHLTGSTTVSIKVTADGNCSGNGNGSGDGNDSRNENGSGNGNDRANGNGSENENDSGNGNGSASATVASSIMTVLLTLSVTLLSLSFDLGD